MSCNTKFTVLTPQLFKRTIVSRLGCCVDKLRDLKTQFGIRPYQVRLVRTRWSGAARGEGQEMIVSVEPIVPTPNVRTINPVNASMQPIGLDEAGNIHVDEISARYTEDQLRGLDNEEHEIPVNEQFYWEILIIKDNEQIMRRFFMSSAPTYMASKFQWEVDLIRASEDRTRTGEPQ